MASIVIAPFLSIYENVFFCKNWHHISSTQLYPSLFALLAWFYGQPFQEQSSPTVQYMNLLTEWYKAPSFLPVANCILTTLWWLSSFASNITWTFGHFITCHIPCNKLFDSFIPFSASTLQAHWWFYFISYEHRISPLMVLLHFLWTRNMRQSCW